ncbi:MAG: response regulator transcription factor [Chloroflexi bacterium]|nr:response regulator transcription factor [Chloroflexota bacterium]
MNEKPEGRIRIILADPSEFTLVGLKQVLEREPGIEVIAAVADGEEVVARTAELEPDVVITEIDLPKLSGDKATQRVRREYPHVAVIILTARDEEQRLFDAIRAGAAAYLPKDCEPGELIETIRKVKDGQFLINEKIFQRPAVASRVLAEFRELSVYGPGSTRVFAPLSPREVQILDNIAQGKTNKEVAYSLAISEQTVKNHMSSILRKLSVNDRTQAVVYAMRQGWISVAARPGGGPPAPREGNERRSGEDRRQEEG